MRFRYLILGLGALSTTPALGQSPLLTLRKLASVRACPPLSTTVIDQLLKGLAEERAQREAMKNTLKGVKSGEVYNECRNQVPMSDEGMKLSEKFANAMDGKSDAQAMAMLQQMAKELQALIDKRCGPDPAGYNDQWKRAKVSDAENAGAEKSGFDKECYDLLKERVLPFCKAPAALRNSATAGGVKIPGVGKGEYGYTAEEARVLNPRCAELVAALEGVL